MERHAEVLGGARLWRDGEPIEPAAQLRTTLFWYLVWSEGWVSRDDLANAFWGDRTDSVARTNLRQQLFQLRRSPLADALQIERERVRYRGGSDVATFRSALRRGDWAAALDSWNGPFLAGIQCPVNVAAETWIESTRSSLSAQWRRVVVARADELERANRGADAADLHESLWRTDVLEERALLEQLRILKHIDRHAEASGAAEAYRRAFQEAMECEPEGPIADVLREMANPEHKLAPSILLDTMTPSSGVPPVPATPLIGREGELATALALLENRTSRLITLTGLGGVGKTRLAVDIVRDAAHLFDTVVWTPLDAVGRDDDIEAILADRVGLSDPASRNLNGICARIAGNDALLAIDQVEHVVDGMRRVVASLLVRCPHLVVLLTSRFALGVASERRLEISGLKTTEEANGPSAAATLFRMRARSYDATFDDDADPAVIETIVRALGGLPLALELTASWAEVLRPDDMVRSLREGHALLEESNDAALGATNLPGILDQTITGLSDRGRRSYRRLAPFRGGFDLDAARAMDVSLASLRELARASLLKRSGGRFQRHPLVVHHAAERAARHPEASEDAAAQHARHFLRLLAATEPTLSQRVDGGTAGKLLRDDQANLREALSWSVDHTPPATFLRAYQHFVLLRRDFAFGYDTDLAERLAGRADGAVRAHLRLANQEWSGRQVESVDRIEQERIVRDALGIADRLRDPVLRGRSLIRLGAIRLREGESDAALDLFRTAARRLRSASGAWSQVATGFLAQAYALTGLTQRRRGAYLAARHDHLRSMALMRRIGDLGLEEMRGVAVTDLAFGHFDAALHVATRMRRCTPDDAPPSVTIAVLGLEARVRLALGDLVGARTMAERRLRQADRLEGGGRQDRLEASHSILGLVALTEGDLDQADRHLDSSGEHHVDTTRRALVALERGDVDRAFRYADEAIAALERLGSPPRRPIERAIAVAAFLEAAFQRNGGDATVASACEALRWATQTRLPPAILHVLLPAAWILDHAEEPVGRDLLRRIASHPAAEHWLRLRAERVADLRVDVAPLRRDLDALRTESSLALDQADRSFAFDAHGRPLTVD